MTSTTSPDTTTPIPTIGPPTKHQLALMIWVAVFPTLTALNLVLGDWLTEVHPVLRTFVLATIAVPIVIYGLMPHLHRLRVVVLRRVARTRRPDAPEERPRPGVLVDPLRQHSKPSSPPQHVEAARAPGSLSTRQLNLMRIGYLVMGAGLAVTKWPELLAHEPWELKHGTVLTMLVALSVLALLGLRHPRAMLPILLFEVGWKLTWLGVVALPLWSSGDLTGATRDQTLAVLWVVIVIAVIPWRHTLRRYALAPGDRWR